MPFLRVSMVLIKANLLHIRRLYAGTLARIPPDRFPWNYMVETDKRILL